MNLLSETIEAIEKTGHTTDDIIFIGSEASGHSCTWDQYQALADHEYDEDFGLQEVAKDLIIVFADGFIMWRFEYDGKERWQWRTPFRTPTESLTISTLFRNRWRRTLREINENLH